MMTQHDLDEFEYEQYCIECELRDRLHMLDLQYKDDYLTEAEVEVLNEAVFEAIKLFLARTIKSIQNAWNKFKGSFGQKDWDKYKDANSKWLETEFILHTPTNGFDFPVLNKVKELMEVKAPKWDKTMDCSTKEKIWQTYFSKWYKNDGDSLKKNILDVCFKHVDESVQMKNKAMIPYIDFMDNYQKYVNQISNVLDVCNHASRDFQTLKSNPFKEDADIDDVLSHSFTEAMFGMFLEAGEGEAKGSEGGGNNPAPATGETNNGGTTNSENPPAGDAKKKDGSNSFTGDDPNKQPKTKEVEGKNSLNKKNKKKLTEKEKEREQLRICKVYFDAITEMFSTMMMVCNRTRAACYKVLTAFVSLNKAEHGATNKKDKSKTTEYTNSQQTNTQTNVITDTNQGEKPNAPSTPELKK